MSFIIEMHDRQKFVLLEFEDYDEGLGDVVEAVKESPLQPVRNTTTLAQTGSQTKAYGEEYSRWFNVDFVVSVYRDDNVGEV